MARDHPGLSSDRFAGGREASVRFEQARPADLVWRTDRRQYADVVLEPARCNVGVLPAERRSAMELEHDLPGHVRLYGDSGRSSGAAAVVPANRTVVAEPCQVSAIGCLSYQEGRPRPPFQLCQN